MDMILERLREKIEKDNIPEIDITDKVMSQVVKGRSKGVFKRKFKLVFTCFLVFFVLSSLFQGLILLNDIFLGFMNNAEEGNTFVKVIQAVKLDELAANIKDLDLVIDIKSIMVIILNFFRDIYYYILELL